MFFCNRFKNVGGMLTANKIDKEVRRGNIIIEPYTTDQLNPNSYNLKLYPELKTYKVYKPAVRYDERKMIVDVNLERPDYKPYLDVKENNDYETIEIPEDGYVLQPGVLYIGRTEEFTSTDKYIPMINGRSSLGRLGISVHICAGFGDVGFSGTWTLEITAVEPVKIYPHLEIAQVCWFTAVGNPKEYLYRGRYFGQEDATTSRSFMNKQGMWKTDVDFI